MKTKSHTITLLGKDYPIKFGMKFQDLFMQRLGIEKIADYQKQLGLLEKMETRQSFKVLAAFIICAVQSGAKKEIDFDDYEVLDFLNDHPEVVTNLTNSFVEAQPSGDLGKPTK
jgi:hypothetical protein